MAAPPPPFRRGGRGRGRAVPSLASRQPPTGPAVSVLNNVLSVTPDSLGIRDRQQNFFHSRLQHEKRDSPESKIQNPGLGIRQNPEFGSRILIGPCQASKGIENTPREPAAQDSKAARFPVPASREPVQQESWKQPLPLTASCLNRSPVCLTAEAYKATVRSGSRRPRERAEREQQRCPPGRRQRY